MSILKLSSTGILRLTNSAQRIGFHLDLSSSRSNLKLMSNSRILKSAGEADERKLQKGPNGRNLCRWCGNEVSGRRRTFCSDECVHEHKIRSQPGYAKREIEKRDKGICCICGLDTAQVERLIEESIPTQVPTWSWKTAGGGKRAREKYHEQAERMFRNKPVQRRFRRWLGIPGHRSVLWDMDHILPVSKGGGECGLENLRTLCIWCHREETAKLKRKE